MELPAGEDPLDVSFAAGTRDDEHPLLRLAEHDLVRGHARRAARHGPDVDAHADAALRGHLARRAGETRRAEILHRLDGVGGDELERRLEQELLKERVADLDRRPLRVRSAAQLEAREERCAGDAVAARVAADEIHRAPRTRLVRGPQVFRASDADAHRVHERVVRKARLEADVAGDVGDADAVAVERDPAGDAGDGPAYRGIVGRPEEERVEHGRGARAHGEDVAEDPAHPGRGTLVGLNSRRVVVALDLEYAEQPAAEIHGAGVLARTHRHARPLRRKGAQQLLRMLVRAVLAPHRAEHRPLELVGLTVEELAHPGSLVRGEADVAGNLVRLRRFCPRHRRGHAHDRKSAPRSVIALKSSGLRAS